MPILYGVILILLAAAGLLGGPRILLRLSKREWSDGERRRGIRLYRGMLAAGEGLLLLRLGPSAIGITAFVLWTVLSLSTVMDIRERRIPNPLTATALAVGLPLQLLLRPLPLMDSLSGFLLFALFFFVLALLPGMGLGDAKLAAVIGLYLGLGSGFVAFVDGFLLGGFYSLGLILSGRGGWRTTFPFGPFLALGALLALLLAPPGSGPLVIRL